MPQRRGGNVAIHASRNFSELSGVTIAVFQFFQIPSSRIEVVHFKGFMQDRKQVENRFEEAVLDSRVLPIVGAE